MAEPLDPEPANVLLELPKDQVASVFSEVEAVERGCRCHCAGVVRVAEHDLTWLYEVLNSRASAQAPNARLRESVAPPEVLLVPREGHAFESMGARAPSRAEELENVLCVAIGGRTVAPEYHEQNRVSKPLLAIRPSLS
jgi:hypothetical protein